jgi:hypothetical protein
MSGSARQGNPPPLEAPVYALGTSPAERDRLRRQSEELRTHSAALLDRVGVERGWNAIDLGCGPSGIIDLLAERVGPEGTASERELDELDQAVREHLDDPSTLVMPNLLFLAWARKPVARASYTLKRNSTTSPSRMT